MLDPNIATNRNPAYAGTPDLGPAAPSVLRASPPTSSSTAAHVEEDLLSSTLHSAIDPIPQGLRDRLYMLHRESRLIPLQSWEGFVISIDEAEGSFLARLSDLEPDAGPDAEEAEFYLSDVDEDDRVLVRPGGVFRWIIGYRDHEYGKRERISSLVFRRLPNWSPSELERARQEGEALARSIRWE